jgi:hypothetical protein
LFSSFASALYYFGLDVSAAFVAEMAYKFASDQEEEFNN